MDLKEEKNICETTDLSDFFSQKKEVCLENISLFQIYALLKKYSRKKLRYVLSEYLQNQEKAIKKYSLLERTFLSLSFILKDNTPLFEYRRRTMENIKKKRGLFAEEQVKKILDTLNIYFFREGEYVSFSGVTPDFLFIDPFLFYSTPIYWIEVKGSIGTKRQYKENMRQTSKYSNYFGNGILIYFYDCEEEIPRITKNGFILSYFEFLKFISERLI